MSVSQMGSPVRGNGENKPFKVNLRFQLGRELRVMRVPGLMPARRAVFCKPCAFVGPAAPNHDFAGLGIYFIQFFV